MKFPQFLMFIPFLKKLMVETSAEAFNKACKILDDNGIQYRMQTIRTRGTVGRTIEAATYMRFNLSQSKWGSESPFFYTIYVLPKDYERASQLTGSIKME